MEFKKFTASEDDGNRRIEKVVRRIFDFHHAECRNVFEILRKNLVKVNGKKIPQSYTVKSGDEISVAKFLLENSAEKNGRTDSSEKIHEDFSGQTVFRNSHIWIFNKKSGIPVQGGGKEFSLAEFVAENSAEKNSLSFKSGPLHRLDKITSGLVSFSQSSACARWFSENLQDRKINKFYAAVCENFFDTDEEKIFSGEIGGKKSVTKILPVARGIFCGKKVTLVKAKIEPGRKHQIRIHLAENFHALLGDEKFGGTEIPQKKFFLHAYKMEFPENGFGLPRKIFAELPDDFFSLATEIFSLDENRLNEIFFAL
jgi:23S rRNA pseudouridine955/2504/2580 synthase